MAVFNYPILAFKLSVDSFLLSDVCFPVSNAVQCWYFIAYFGFPLSNVGFSLSCIQLLYDVMTPVQSLSYNQNPNTCNHQVLGAEQAWEGALKHRRDGTKAKNNTRKLCGCVKNSCILETTQPWEVCD